MNGVIITIWTGRFNGQKKKEKRLGAAIQKKKKMDMHMWKAKKKRKPVVPSCGP